jgi:signal transduction histidine kinase/ligand-binding sensor domain-containing protein
VKLGSGEGKIAKAHNRRIDRRLAGVPKRTLALAAAFVLGGAVSARALDPQRANSQYVITRWGAGTLPSNSISALVQTRDRQLWLGTAAGLVRFDGSEFVVFSAANTPSFGDGGASRLAEASDGTLLVGTTAGTVLRYAHGAFAPLGLPAGSAYVSSLLAAKDGSVWIGMPGHDTSRWHDGQRETFPEMRGSQAPLAMAEDAQGGIWIGTRRRGLIAYEAGTLHNYDVTADMIQALCFDRTGALWIGTAHGLLRFQRGKTQRYTKADGLSHDNVTALLEDRDGNLWVGTAGGGLNRRTAGRFSRLTTLEGLSDDDVRALLEDHEGNLWVGTADGLNCLGEGRFTTYGRFEGLHEPAVASVAPSADGGVWLGLASGGVARLRGGVVEHFALPAGVGWETARALHETRDGSLWIAQDNGRLFRLKDGAVSEQTPQGSPPDRIVRAIWEDEKGPVFLVGILGPARLQGRRLVPLQPSPRLGWLRYPHAAYGDGRGTLWVCDLHGLARLRDGEWKLFTTDDGLPRTRVRSASLEPDGSLWAATAGGLAYLKDDVIRQVTTQQGLPENYLRLVLDDRLGHLWVASMGHLFRLDKRELLDLFAGRAARVRPVLFDTSDGLRTTEGLLGNSPGFRAADGRLWFATAKGASVIDPARVSLDEPAPRVTVERLTVDGQPAAADGAAHPPGRGEVHLAYTAPSFRAPGKIRFRHRLHGFDPGWVDGAQGRYAYYSSLPPGRYRLSVMASNRDGIWNGEEAAVAFAIRPPFHRTPVFYTGAAALLLGLAATAHRLRLRQMRARFTAVVHERTRIARELHDTLAQGLAGAKLHIDSALSALGSRPELARRSIECAQSITRSSLGEVRRSIWVLRAQAAKGEEDLRASLTESLAQLAADSGLSPSVRVEGQPGRLPVEVERNLLRVAHEAVTNAIRHSGGRTLAVELRFAEGAAHLCVRDDGRGFDPESYLRGTRGEHFGLLGMRERVQGAGGALEIRSEEGWGTEIVCRLPYNGHNDSPSGEAAEGAMP